jgi:membrane-associated phospholipid phosphatase
MRLLLFALCPLLLANSAALSQNDNLASPYSFKWKRDLIASSAAAVLAVGGYFTSSRLKPLTESQVNSLDPYNLTGVDRAAINNWSPGSATASDVLLYSSFVLPGVMMLNKRMRKDYLVIGFIYAEVGMLTYGLTDLTKGLAKRVRPYAYNGDVDLEFRTTKGARQSFFSGHTAMTAALAFTTAKIFSDYSDNPVHEALVWTGAAVLPIATASLRYAAGRHFPTDVIAGYFIGATIGYMVPWLHRRKPLVKGMTLAPYSNGGREIGFYVNYRL